MIQECVDEVTEEQVMLQQQEIKMLFVSGKSPSFNLTHKVYEFFTDKYEISSDVEVFHTNLRDENAVGFTEVNGEEQFVQVCNTLNERGFVTTLLHELSTLFRMSNGMIDEVERESEAYRLEEILYNNYCASEGTVH